MFGNSENLILTEYNINLIDLNFLLKNKIELNISNFLYDNNLNLNITAKDLSKIINHFIVNEILSALKENINNVILFNNNYNLQFLVNFEEEVIKNIINDKISKSSKIFNFNLFFVNSDFRLDKNSIYKFKSITENRKIVNLKRVKLFCEKNNLNYLSAKVSKDIKTKLLITK